MASGAFPLFQNKAGDNQSGSYGTGMPGVVPAAPSYGDKGDLTGTQAVSGGTYKQANGLFTFAPMSPNFTTDFMNYLKGQIGNGATPFNLSASMPSSGVTTAPGQLSAPLTPVLQQLADFYSGKATTLPGADAVKQGLGTLGDISKTGLPIDQTPAWQAMIAAQQRNIGMNEAGLREQFASMGSLRGSPFGQAESDYRMQTSKDQNAMLAQMVQQAQESAAGRRLSAGGALTQAGGALTEGASSLGQVLQGLDQASLDRMLQEFVRTRPEYSPYLNMLYGAATTFPPQANVGKSGGLATGLAGSLGSAAGTAIGGPIGKELGKEAGKGADVIINFLKGLF
jgi:hypothetical protein